MSCALTPASFLQFCKDGDLKSVMNYMSKKLSLSPSSFSNKSWVRKSWDHSVPKMIDNGLKETVKKDHLQIFQFLIECVDLETISTFQKFLRMAVKTNSWQIIDFILCCPRFIKTHLDRHILLDILTLAVKCHQPKIEQCVLKHLKHYRCLIMSRLAQLKGAVQGNRLDVVENILTLHAHLDHHCMMFAVNEQNFAVLQKIYDMMGLDAMKIDPKQNNYQNYSEILYNPQILEWFIKKDLFVDVVHTFKQMIVNVEPQFLSVASCFFQFGTNAQKISIIYLLMNFPKYFGVHFHKPIFLKTLSVALDYGCPLSDVSGLSDVQQLIGKRSFQQKLLIHCLQSVFDTFTTSQVICAHLSFFPSNL